MDKIIQWCKERNIPLSEAQLKVVIPFIIIGIYSYYTTKLGNVFYVKTKKNKLWFLHILLNGKFICEDGYDGGDLSRYKKREER